MQTILILTYILHQTYGQDLKYICETDNEIKVNNGFVFNEYLVLFSSVRDEHYCIKIKGLKFNREKATIDRIDSVEIWSDWDLGENNNRLDQIKDIYSIHSFILTNDNSVIFLVKSPDKIETNLTAVEVKYNLDLTKIDSHKYYYIEPFDTRHKDDVLNLFSLFEYFPEDYITNAKPVISLKLNIKEVPNSSLVYYYETSLDNSLPAKYRVHILMSINDVNDGNVWVYDIFSGECIELDVNNRVDSAVVLPKTSVLNKTHKSLELIEFYPKGKYQIKQIVFNLKPDKNQSLGTNWNKIYESDIRSLICFNYRPEITSTDNGLPLVWIILFVFIIFVVLLCSLFAIFKRKMRDHRPQSSDFRDKQSAEGKNAETTAMKPLPVHEDSSPPPSLSESLSLSEDSVTSKISASDSIDEVLEPSQSKKESIPDTMVVKADIHTVPIHSESAKNVQRGSASTTPSITSDSSQMKKSDGVKSSDT